MAFMKVLYAKQLLNLLTVHFEAYWGFCSMKLNHLTPKNETIYHNHYNITWQKAFQI